MRCALESSLWVPPKTPVLVMKRTVCGAGLTEAVLKAPQLWEEGWEASALVVLVRGPHSEDTGARRVSPPPAHRLLTARCSEALHRAQPSLCRPLWAALCEFSCFLLLFCFPSFFFLLILFSFSSTFVFLSSIDYSHLFPPYFVVILYISFTLKS